MGAPLPFPSRGAVRKATGLSISTGVEIVWKLAPLRAGACLSGFPMNALRGTSPVPPILRPRRATSCPEPAASARWGGEARGEFCTTPPARASKKSFRGKRDSHNACTGFPHRAPRAGHHRTAVKISIPAHFALGARRGGKQACGRLWILAGRCAPRYCAVPGSGRGKSKTPSSFDATTMRFASTSTARATNRCSSGVKIR